MDRETFNDFYAETASALRAYVIMTCRNRALADDVVQEAYLRMLRRNLPELDAARRKSYLYKAAHSVLIDHHRARQRDARLADSYAASAEIEHVGPAGEAIVAARPDPYADILPPDMLRVFETLKSRQQTLLWLAYVEGFTHDEIAEVVDVDSRSVRVLLSRARAELAARLDESGLAPAAAHGGRYAQ